MTEEDRKQNSDKLEQTVQSLDDATLDKVAGGLMGGDDDLKDLEVERIRRR